MKYAPHCRRIALRLRLFVTKCLPDLVFCRELVGSSLPTAMRCLGGALHDRRRPLRTATLSALAGHHGPRIFRCLSGATMRRLRLIGICDWLGLLTRLRLSPEGYSLAELIRQTRAALAAGTGCSC